MDAKRAARLRDLGHELSSMRGGGTDLDPKEAKRICAAALEMIRKADPIEDLARGDGRDYGNAFGAIADGSLDEAAAIQGFVAVGVMGNLMHRAVNTNYTPPDPYSGGAPLPVQPPGVQVQAGDFPAREGRRVSTPVEQILGKGLVEAPTMKPDEGKRDRRSVWVVHGRNGEIRESIDAYLRALGLEPKEWPVAAADAGEETGEGSAYVGKIISSGIEAAAAVVVVLTPDDLGCASKQFWETRDGDGEKAPRGQARLNVVFEAGLAYGLRKPTLLVQVGDVRSISDVAGRYVYYLDDTQARRKTLAVALARFTDAKLENSGWEKAGRFAVLAPSPFAPSATPPSSSLPSDPPEQYPPSELLLKLRKTHGGSKLLYAVSYRRFLTNANLAFIESDQIFDFNNDRKCRIETSRSSPSQIEIHRGIDGEYWAIGYASRPHGEERFASFETVDRKVPCPIECERITRQEEAKYGEVCFFFA